MGKRSKRRTGGSGQRNRQRKLERAERAEREPVDPAEVFAQGDRLFEQTAAVRRRIEREGRTRPGDERWLERIEAHDRDLAAVEAQAGDGVLATVGGTFEELRDRIMRDDLSLGEGLAIVDEANDTLAKYGLAGPLRRGI